MVATDSAAMEVMADQRDPGISKANLQQMQKYDSKEITGVNQVPPWRQKKMESVLNLAPP